MFSYICIYLIVLICVHVQTGVCVYMITHINVRVSFSSQLQCCWKCRCFPSTSFLNQRVKIMKTEYILLVVAPLLVAVLTSHIPP